MSGQSEAERLNAITSRLREFYKFPLHRLIFTKSYGDDVEWLLAHVDALQAQVEQLQKALDEDTKLFQGRWEASEKREAALREALRELERLAIAEGGEDADLFPNENLVLVTVRRALSEQKREGMSGQSEAERPDFSGYGTRQQMRETILTLQAQVEQLKGELSESDGDWVGIAAAQTKRALAAEKREAALREALKTIAKEWQGNLGTGEMLTEFCSRALSEQSESERSTDEREVLP